MWNDMTIVVRAVFPALILLRLADRKQPGMDKLYYFVRQLDKTLLLSATLLNDIQKNYTDGQGGDVTLNIVKYFLSSAMDVTDYCNELNYENSSDSDDDESEAECLPDKEIEDDLDSVASDATDDLDEPPITLLGDKIITAWEHRKKKLICDLSIAGWMICPMENVRKDVKENDNGEHRNAMERLIKKWYSHEVSSFLF